MVYKNKFIFLYLFIIFNRKTLRLEVLFRGRLQASPGRNVAKAKPQTHTRLHKSHNGHSSHDEQMESREYV